MKKLIMTGLLAIGSIVMAESAQDVLRKAREDYYRQQKEASRPVKEEKVKKEKMPKQEKMSGKRPSGQEMEAAEGMSVEMEEEVSEEVKPKTPMEKLEYNAAKARDRVDFYERVVRSVEREEKELGGYNEILGRNRKKPAKVVKEKKVNKKK